MSFNDCRHNGVYDTFEMRLGTVDKSHNLFITLFHWIVGPSVIQEYSVACNGHYMVSIDKQLA